MINLQKVSLTTQELREFGFSFGAIFAVIFGLILPWLFDSTFPLWPWFVFLITSSLAVIYPPSLTLFYKMWMMFGIVMGWINTRIILGVVFFFIFMPFGLVMRLFRKDLLLLKIDKKIKSYRISNQKHDRENMEDPF